MACGHGLAPELSRNPRTSVQRVGPVSVNQFCQKQSPLSIKHVRLDVLPRPGVGPGFPSTTGLWWTGEHPQSTRTPPQVVNQSLTPGKLPQPTTRRRSSQSPSEEEPQSLPRTQEQPVTLGRIGPKSNQSPLQEEDPGAASHPGRKRTQEQPITLGGRGPRSIHSSSEEENQGTVSNPQRKRIQEQPDTIGTRDLSCPSTTVSSLTYEFILTMKQKPFVTECDLLSCFVTDFPFPDPPMQIV
ncbi:hypothetical protein STEG23_029154 [Scotinomys teguina]